MTNIITKIKRWYRTTWLGRPLVFCPKCKSMPADWNKQRFVYDGDKLVSFYCDNCKIRFKAEEGIFVEEELKKAYRDMFGFDPY